MGIRGEIYSEKVILPNRTYFFNVKENRLGDLYLNIVESKNRDNGGFDRQSVILFADDLQEFLKGFEESLKVLEKATREKRHGGKGGAKREGSDKKISRGDAETQRPQREDRGSERPRRERSGDGVRGDRPARGFKARNDKPRGDRPDRERGKERSFGNRERGDKPARSDRPARGGDRPDRGRRNDRERKPGGERGGRDRGSAGGKRVVVRKRD